MAARFDNKTLWLVQQVWWEFDEESPFGGWLCADLDFGKPLTAFTTRAAAEAEAQRLQREARAEKNPFTHGRSIDERTSMPESVFCDWLEDAGIEPPGIDEDSDWGDWWHAQSGSWTQQQRDKVWEALDLVRFSTVVKLPPPAK